MERPYQCVHMRDLSTEPPTGDELEVELKPVCLLRCHPRAHPGVSETDRICSALGLDPLKLIALGALLIVVGRDGPNSVLKAIEATGVPIAVIGEVCPIE